MSPRWKWFLPGYLWALPHTLVGLLLALVYRAHSFRWSDGCLEAIGGRIKGGTTRIWGTPAAQTHGWLIFYADEVYRTHSPFRVHERAHVVQGFIGGPLFVLAYGIAHLVGWLRTGSFWAGYHANPFEVAAYAAGDHAWPGDWGYLADTP